MPRVEIDLQNVETPIDVGTYNVEITGCEVKQAKNPPHNTQLSWTLQITDEGNFFGRKLFYNSNLGDRATRPDGSADVDAQKKAGYYLREFLRKFGVQYDPNGFDTDSALHAKALAKVKHETYEGRTMSRVEDILAIQS